MSVLLRSIRICARSFSTGVVRRGRDKAAATSSTALENYTAVNEPILGYEAGSPERQELEEKLAEYSGRVHEVPLVIGEEEITTGESRHQVMPFDHQKKLAKFYYADKNLINRAIQSSLEAQQSWSRLPLTERAEIFRRAGDLVAGKYRMDLMAATMLGQGKTIIQGEIDAACELVDFYRFNVQWAMDLLKWSPIDTKESTNTIMYRPVEGFWAAIAPFNFTAISGHLAGAPAMMGNVVLWKPSDTSVLSSYVCFRLLREAGVPPGVINFLPADGPTFGDTVTANRHLGGINFTGSARTFYHLWQQVGQNITNYKSFPRLIGECGGKNFHFIHPSATDVAHIVNGTIRSAFEFGGQKCSACSRMYVPESLWPSISAGLLKAHANIQLGPPTNPQNFLSALIDDKAFARVKEYIDYGKSKHSVLAGGTCDDSVGYYVEPTIIQVSDPWDRLMSEEIFGPVLTVYVYPDAEWRDTVNILDCSTEYSLTGAIYADEQSAVSELSDLLRFTTGNYYINDKSTGSVVAQQPFGGARKSGTNDKAGSPHYLLRFVSPQATKTTHVSTPHWDYPYMRQ